jgi:HlyD family secretion protein
VKKLWQKLPWSIVALLLLAGLFYGFWPEPVRVDAVPVRKGTLRVTVNDDGETRIREKYVISSPMTGQLLRVQLNAGDEVEAGETVIAQIVPSAPSLLDSRARAELEARVQAAEAAKMQADAALESARQLEGLAQHSLERAIKLVSTASISAQEMDETEHQAAVAKANVRAAEFTVKVKSYEVQQARAALGRIQNAEKEDPSSTIPLLAPTNGRVLRVLREDTGVIPVGTSLVEIGDVSDLELVMDILSTEAVRIKPGNLVEVIHWGGRESLHAIVRRVEPAAFLKVSALGVEEKRVNVIADFVEPISKREGLGDGFRIEAKITVAESPADSLKVPTSALFRNGDHWHIYLVRDSRALSTKVEIGLTNGTETEIRSGVDELDKVIIYPAEQVRDGVRLRTTER